MRLALLPLALILILVAVLAYYTRQNPALPVAPCACSPPDPTVSNDIHAAHRRVTEVEKRLRAELAGEREARVHQVDAEQRARKEGLSAARTARDGIRGVVATETTALARRLDAIEAKIRAMDLAPAPKACQCKPHSWPVPVEKPAPKAAVPSGPAYEWRRIGGADYYGYQDGDVFRYTAFRLLWDCLP